MLGPVHDNFNLSLKCDIKNGKNNISKIYAQFLKMNFRDLITQKKEIYEKTLTFIDNEEYNEEQYNDLINHFNKSNLPQKKYEFREYLYFLSNIEKCHKRDTEFYTKIKQILQYFLGDMKQQFSNLEIFTIFQKSKLLILFLLENKVIFFDKFTIKLICDNYPGERYLYFAPELESNMDNKAKQLLQKDLQKQEDNFMTKLYQKRLLGENDSHICQLIRDDSVEEFISYVNRTNISLSSKIIPSIFETHQFLIENNPTLIEYAVFFGSIQIFHYLRLNNVKLTSSLWKYAIHSRNAEMIHILEEYNSTSPKDYNLYLEESIQCHHNEIAKYFQDNYDAKISSKECLFKSYNYSFFEMNEALDSIDFFYLLQYKHLSFFEILSKTTDININQKVVLNLIIFFK